MSESTYKVTGMTCSHCADAITKEITSSVSGVLKVDVDVEAGLVTVVSESALSLEDVRAALDEAGDYELVGA